MSLAKKVDTITAPVSCAVSSRRSLFGGAAAVVLGSGITAGVAASAADFLPNEDADAVLVALCTHAEAADVCSIAVLDAIEDDLQPTDPRWSAGYDQSSLIFEECRAGMNKAAEIPFQTAEGLRAKASLALREMISSDFDAFPLVLSVLKQLAGKA